jgi:hypothetical protein
MAKEIASAGLKTVVKAVAPASLLPFLRNAYRTLNNRVVGTESVFAGIYHRGEWLGAESVSGPGSGLGETERLRAALPPLLSELGVRSMLDAPCGDFNWMRDVPLGEVDYIGGDIVRELVDADQRQYGGPRRRFLKLDLMRDVPPRADLVLCRDCFIHLPYDGIRAALRNFKASGARYLLTTHYPGVHKPAHDITLGQFRAFNFELAPFRFPPPLRAIIDGPLDGTPWMGRSIALWRFEDLSF